jgi:hypothetical protein
VLDEENNEDMRPTFLLYSCCCGGARRKARVIIIVLVAVDVQSATAAGRYAIVVIIFILAAMVLFFFLSWMCSDPWAFSDVIVSVLHDSSFPDTQISELSIRSIDQSSPWDLLSTTASTMVRATSDD